MFTGIVEANSKIKKVTRGDQSVQIRVEKPLDFDDLQIGDSIACNGVCLTVEEFDSEIITFTVGYETLKITGWTADDLNDRSLNLERSLRFGDRIHGHLVSGHVDGVAQVLRKQWQGDCLVFEFSLPKKSQNEIWKKSSVAINGVSLTVNDVNEKSFEVCLVPETLRKTNLDDLQEGDSINLETDYYMKGLLKSQGAQDAQRA